jgi:hypothetical protein
MTVDQGERVRAYFVISCAAANIGSPPLNPKEIPMKKIAPKKMTLSRETLGTLSDSEVKEALGGAFTDKCTTSMYVCCN